MGHVCGAEALRAAAWPLGKVGYTTTRLRDPGHMMDRGWSATPSPAGTVAWHHPNTAPNYEPSIHNHNTPVHIRTSIQGQFATLDRGSGESAMVRRR
jgi:hypothetical protein